MTHFSYGNSIGSIVVGRQLRPVAQDGGEGVVAQVPLQNKPSFFAGASSISERPVSAAIREQATTALRSKQESPARLSKSCLACIVASIARQSEAS
jgi:hypothetical protein